MATPNGTPREVWVCGSKDLDVPDVVGLRALEIRPGHVKEVPVGREDAGAGVVDVQERLEIREFVGRFEACHGGVGQRDSVPLRQGEHELGLERPFDVQMRLCFRQVVDEGSVIVYGGE